ncbi:arsenate reductase-like glutaredoxin family protein [Rheinheimera pacifica]|uniref:KAP family NTPase n=1 Tax=Rheinheimera pacifica TaxID=173990 RepID=UPI002169EF11|nr:KAP family NTPase [Rheinheimera pacifica]MCS4306735.1 arsenate reductase-like glutaredoxin family protein [Rheinheimera pacifica]
MEKDKIYRKLAFLFEDKSMPSMVLLDGKWGSGKSYYLNNELIPFLTKEKKKIVVSFSLYGVANIDDFRDKLISAFILKNKNATSILDKLITSVAGATAFTSSDNSSALLSIFNGIKGAAKHVVLSKIEKFTLVLDDLERVDDLNLIKAILGECLQLAENNEVEVLIAANSEAIKDLNEAFDKCISDKISFSLDYEKAAEIAFNGLQDKIPKQNMQAMLESIRKLEIKNLRVLKRSAKRIAELIEELHKKTEIDEIFSANILIPKIISIANAHYQLGFSCAAIKKNVNSRQSRLFLELTDTALTPEEEEQRKIFDLAESSSDDIIEYACGEKFSASEIEDFGALPAKSNLLDKLIYAGTRQISQAEFSTAYKQLIEYINRTSPVECHYWFNCIDTLDLLIRQKSITKPDFIEGTVLEFATSKLKVVKFSLQAKKRSTPRRLVNDELQAMMVEQFNIVKIRDTESSIDHLKTRMLKNWKQTDSEIYSNYEHKPFFNIIGAEFLIQCLNRWDHSDILGFEDFIRSRYNFSNVKDFYTDEAYDLNFLLQWLIAKIKDCQPNLKNGAFYELSETLANVVEKLS